MLGCMRLGIKRITNLLTDEGTFLSYQEFQAKYQGCISWLQYYSLLAAIPSLGNSVVTNSSRITIQFKLNP